MRSFHKTLALATLLGLTASSWAQETTVHSAEAKKGHYAATLANLGIGQPWSRAVPPTSPTGAVFVEIDNQGPVDHLLAAHAEIAETLELHTHLEQDGLLRMVQVDRIEVPGPNGRLELRPGGYHIMLIGLKQPLREGDSFPLQLEFERSGLVELTVEVRNFAAGTGADHDHHHDQHGHHHH